ncbi:MAG TPA: MOSC domain-containing protein [Nocardioides sp.]|uniref:MOSC domain-containing protein n=1 Tax=uncultured Nocardioides sp. TaxID=198441 RepID=UPI00260EEF50|nr:MOSC domain-containing protein [uncultured Nocardioides sp.]HRD63142.1 MOSC domain-containing protein [Nocardioides sp.]HRI96311.1 MOSC domain-containing protein [Nocardioides sp.]HRK46536.1 MOSC domain-containing protein [Nocardioides sp.]
MQGVVRSVNVGTPREAAWAGIGRTSIDKASVTGPVQVHSLGLEGDQVSDTRHHGGPDQAVYAFAREELDWWSERLGDQLRDGEFGENLTTSGLDVDGAELGERWRIGTALFEVRSVRTPCNDFKVWMGRGGHDNTAWVRRFAEHARPGAYLRVLEPGVLAAGDPIEVVHRPGHGVTVSYLFRAVTREPDLLPGLLAVDGLVEKARRRALEAATGQ